jgi:hypothetical protein
MTGLICLFERFNTEKDSDLSVRLIATTVKPFVCQIVDVPSPQCDPRGLHPGYSNITACPRQPLVKAGKLS